MPNSRAAAETLPFALVSACRIACIERACRLRSLGSTVSPPAEVVMVSVPV
jgi:hypothetical protein